MGDIGVERCTVVFEPVVFEPVVFEPVVFEPVVLAPIARREVAPVVRPEVPVGEPVPVGERR